MAQSINRNTKARSAKFVRSARSALLRAVSGCLYLDDGNGESEGRQAYVYDSKMEENGVMEICRPSPQVICSR